LDALNARVEAAAPPPEDLSVVFNTAPPAQSLPSAAAFDALAAAMGAASAEPVPSHYNPPPLRTGPPPLRAEQPPRIRGVRPPPDLSKLPPGIAASLAKLAGQGPDSAAVPPLPKRPLRRT
jgi:hypothetical protein